MRRPGLVLLLAAGLAAAGCAAPERPLVVFAAASLADAADVLAALHHAETGQPVAVSTGASSTLARQIDAGAPADVALLAGTDWAAWLAARDRLAAPPETLATSALVVLGPADAEPWREPRELLGVERLALADPAHVPAGRYARAALERAGLWAELAPRVVPSRDVRAAALAVATGAADAAVVYAPDARAVGGTRAVLPWPDSLGAGVAFVALRLRGGRGGAAGFVSRARARGEVWRELGFAPFPR